MKILAIEFSSPQRSVAVLDQVKPGDPARSSLPVPIASTGLAQVIESGQMPNSFALIEQALSTCGIDREQIECIAVGIGPGSYNGIRAAIALAQGWQLATEVKLLAISSVEAVAAAAVAEGISGPVAVVIDAQRGEFYLSEWSIEDRSARESGKLRLADRRAVESAQGAGHLLIGPEVTKWFPAGCTVFPRAAALAQLAAARTGFVAGEQIQPIYLRPVSFVKAPPPRKLPG